MVIVHVPVLVRIHKGIIDLNVQNNMYIGLWGFFHVYNFCNFCLIYTCACYSFQWEVKSMITAVAILFNISLWIVIKRLGISITRRHNS